MILIFNIFRNFANRDGKLIPSDMSKLNKNIPNKLSVRLSLMVVVAIATLLVTALLIMFLVSRQTVKEEALQKADQSLEGVVQHIDNILFSVEQSSGNMYWNMLNHLDKPDMMYVYSRKLVESNPYIVGCAIVFEPNYYKDRGELFMAYAHRPYSSRYNPADTTIIMAETYANRPYTQQIWYTQPMKIKKPCWIGPLKNDDMETEPLITFCLPIYVKQDSVVGVLAVDVSLTVLTQIVYTVKPSAGSYCTLLSREGSYIIHPDSTKLFHETVFTQKKHNDDLSIEEVGRAMVSGEKGYKYFRLNGVDNYVFYQPFKRASAQGRFWGDLGWSAGVIYPEDDIFGDYNRLLYYVLTIAFVGLLLLLLLCYVFITNRLKPLRMLTKSAQRIAEGHFDEPIPDSRQQDEIGHLQNSFQRMQKSLSIRVGELEQLKTLLQERGEVLRSAYNEVQEADRLKTSFLHHMTDQMIPPVNQIDMDVKTLCDHIHDVEQDEAHRLTDDIQSQGKTLTELLNNLLDISQEKMKKNEK